MSVWNWLVANGLYRDLLSACILVPILKFTSSSFAKRLAKEIAIALRKGWYDLESDLDDIKDDAKDDLDHVA